MRNKGILLVAFLAINCVAVVSRAEVNWQADILPASLFANLQNSEFSLQKTDIAGVVNKESMSMISSLPNLSFGISVDRSPLNLELKGGIGMLLNSRMSSLKLSGTAGVSLEVRPNAFLGLHGKLAYMSNPSWWGDGEVDLEANNPAFGIGAHAAMGDKISYFLSVDYMSMSFDAVGRDGWTASDNELDMSGVAIQFGIRTTF